MPQHDLLNCASCGGALAPAFISVDPEFSVSRCGKCGLGQTRPVVPDDEIGRYYPSSYYGRENVRFNPLFEAMTHLFQKRRSRVIHNRVARGPVLDVGCGRGFLLSFLSSLGYEAHGTELSELSAWHARHRLHLDIKVGDFAKLQYPRESFNAVVFWHTLEHFARPDEILARAADLLKPGGLIAVAVPNFESLQASFFGRHWFHLDVPRHYFHFGSRSLESLLAKHGLRLVQSDHFCFEQNPYGWLQSFYNLLGFDNNFLYSLLKNKSARTISIRKHPIQALLTLALLVPLLSASLLMTLVEAALRRGGTIEVYAIKE
jgi:SAM-dependent methyltransferase